MKKKLTLALAASIFTLALAAIPHTALAAGRLRYSIGGGMPPPPPPPVEASIAGMVQTALWALLP
jgi:hypothetical protein